MPLTLNHDGTISSSVVNTDATNTRLGIGTSTPEYMLHLKGSYPYIAFEDTDNANTSIGTITGNSDGNIYYDANFNNINGVGGGHRWRINGAALTPMYIDQTTGLVLMPNQPAFNAYLIPNPAANGYSTGGVYHASSTGIGVNPTNILILKHTILNRGNHYNTSTGLFTAPVAGVYRFHHAHLPDNTQGGNSDNWAEFYINGGSTDAPEMYAQTSQLSQHGVQLSGSAVFQLQAGDTVGVYVYGGMHQRYVTFNGYLIG